MVTKKKAAPKRPTTDVDDVHVMVRDAASRTDMPTLPRVDMGALRRRRDLSVEQWRGLAALFANERNGLAELVEGATAQVKTQAATYDALIADYEKNSEDLLSLLKLSNEMLRVVVAASNANASGSKRQPHKTPAAQAKLLKFFAELRVRFVEANPGQRSTDTAVLDWYNESVRQAVGRSFTRAQASAMSKTLRNRISAARKALAQNPEKSRTSG
jgi:hypothetical protein